MGTAPNAPPGCKVKSTSSPLASGNPQRTQAADHLYLQAHHFPDKLLQRPAGSHTAALPRDTPQITNCGYTHRGSSLAMRRNTALPRAPGWVSFQYHTICKKPDMEGHTLHVPTYMKCLGEAEHRQVGAKGWQGRLLMRTGYPFQMTDRHLSETDSGRGCTAL